MVAGVCSGRRAAGGIEWDRGFEDALRVKPAVLRCAGEEAAESASQPTRADGEAAREHSNNTKSVNCCHKL